MKPMRSALTLMLLCVTLAGCQTIKGVCGIFADQTAPQPTMCPARPAVSATRMEGGYFIPRSDMAEVLIYLKALEANCGR